MKNYSFAQVKTRTFPTVSDVKHPYIFGNIRSVINVSEKEDADIKALYSQLGIDYHFYPTKEECSDMNWDNIKAATSVLVKNIKNEIPTIVHCIGGNNRSPMIVECAYYSLFGEHYADEYKNQLNHLIYNSQFIGKSTDDIETELKSLSLPKFFSE